MQDMEEMKEIAGEVRMETILDLLGLDRPNTGHKIASINNPEETVPSLHIYEYDWYDFSSGEGGDQITFVQKYFGCNFWKALTFICQAEGMDGPRKQIVAEKPLPDLTDRFFAEPEGDSEAKKRAEEKIKDKWPYLTLEDVEEYGVKITQYSMWVPFWYNKKVVGIKTRSLIGADSKMSVKGSRFTSELYCVLNRPQANIAWICEGESDTWCLSKTLKDDDRHTVYGLPAGAGCVKASWFNGWNYQMTFLLLDDDPAGRRAAEKITEYLGEDHQIEGLFLPGGRLAEALAEGWIPPVLEWE